MQARSETVKSRMAKEQVIEHFSLSQKGKVLVKGQSAGQKIGNGVARIVLDPKKMRAMKPGEILITEMTDPAW